MSGSSPPRSKANALGFDARADGFYQGTGGGSLRFTSKHVFSTKNNPLCGITFSKWMRMLLKFGKWIEVKYYFRALFITVLSVLNSVLSWVETWLYASRIEAVVLPEDPVFVVGHPRTGTTLIHNLLASDNDNFFYCTTFCAGFPSAFLWFESIGKKLFASAMGKTRPMDAMPLHFDLPQEDELAANMLSSGCSYYMPLWFMKQEPYFRRYLDFSPADGASPDDEGEWLQAFVYMMKKVCLRNEMLQKRACPSSAKRLLIKSPVHTARIPLLRRLFPKAKFIYIHRHPDEVLLSMAHMLDTTYWYCYLNTPSNEQIQEFILWQFEHMWRKYNNAVTDTNGSPSSTYSTRSRTHQVRDTSDDVLEIGYAHTTANLKSTIEDIYKHIGIPWTRAANAHFSSEEELLASYRPNVHKESLLTVELKELIRNRWGSYFDAFGYK